MWANAKNDRGKTAINWTISPSMADIGPGILNYYYENSTEKECFVAGPSGVGYIMPLNSQLPPTNYLTEVKYAADYARLTEIYLQKSGIRVITLWDGALNIVRDAYERYCRNLYGITIQDWNNRNPPLPETTPSIVNDRLRFEYMRISYASNYDNLLNTIAGDLNNWDGLAPVFLTYQIRAWTPELNTTNVVRMENELRGMLPDIDFEFVRADHYFSYYNEFNNLPFNLCMLSSAEISSNDSQNCVNIADGTTASLWVSQKTGSGVYLQFDFKENYSINRYVIRHAETYGDNKLYNTKAWRFNVSTDGQNWTTIDTYSNNISAVTDIDLKPVDARYVRITILDPGRSKEARIAELEIYGRKI